MSTIAWDGRTLAADRCRTNGDGMQQTVCKLHDCGEFVYGAAASGTGAGIALAAMACGKMAREAVELAARFDCGTGMGLDAYDI